jgi:hypothetical protein
MPARPDDYQGPLLGCFECPKCRSELSPTCGRDSIHVIGLIQGDPADGSAVGNVNEHGTSLFSIFTGVPAGGGEADTIRRRMGFNPFREQRTSVLDIAIVVIALSITAAVVIWAIGG